MPAFVFKIVFVLMIAVPPAAAISPKELLDRFEQVVEDTRAYQCRIVAWSVHEDELESRIANVYFKQPEHVRMDILVGTRRGDDGSRAVLKPDGRVVAKSGSVFMPFALSFSVENRLVTTIRGQTIFDSVLVGILRQIRERLAASDALVKDLEDTYVLHLDLRRPSDFRGVTAEELTFDKETLLPLSNDTYEGSTQVQHVVWRDYIINEDLPDELFTIRFDPERLAERGISTVANVAISHQDVVESRMDSEEL